MTESDAQNHVLGWSQEPYVLEMARLLLLNPQSGTLLYERMRMIDCVLIALSQESDKQAFVRH